jgi:hypothetical protein
MAARTENPLQRGCSPEARSANIRELRGTGRPVPQAIRIAYEEQRRQGCAVPPAPRKPNPAPVPKDPKLKKAYDLFAADFKKKSGGPLQNVSASYETKYDGERDVPTGRIEGAAYYAGWSGEGQLYINYVLEGGAPRIWSIWVSWDKLPATMLPAATAMYRVARQVREDVLHAREGELDGGEFDKPPKIGARQFSVHARAAEGADTDLAWIMVFEPAVKAMRGGRKGNPATPRVVAGESVLNRELLALPGRRWRASDHVHVECDADGYCVVVEAPGRQRQVHRAKNPAEAAKKARTVSLVAAGVVNPNAPKAPDRRGKPLANPVTSAGEHAAQQQALAYDAKLQAALLTPGQFPGRYILEKLAQLPAARYPTLRKLALAELRVRLGFQGANEEKSAAWEAYIEGLHKHAVSAGHDRQTTFEELHSSSIVRAQFQGPLSRALEGVRRGNIREAAKDLNRGLKRTTSPAPRRRRNPTTVPREARYQAAVLTPKAFSGRKNLQQWAAQNHPLGDVYLAQLRVKLGFKGAEEELAEAKEALIQHDLKFAGEGKVGSGHGSVYGGGAVAYLTKEELAVRSQTAQRLLAMPQRERVHWAFQQDSARRAAERAGTPLSNELISNLNLAGDIAKDELELREGKHSVRVATAQRGDPLAERTVGHGEREMIRGRLRKTILAGSYPTRHVFRTASRSHKDVVVVVEPGAEKAITSTEIVRTHRHHSWTALTSQHEWHVSRTLLSKEVRALNQRARQDKIIYLRPDLRVVQGRGIRLVMQKKTGTRGGWS